MIIVRPVRSHRWCTRHISCRFWSWPSSQGLLMLQPVHGQLLTKDDIQILSSMATLQVRPLPLRILQLPLSICLVVLGSMNCTKSTMKDWLLPLGNWDWRGSHDLALSKDVFWIHRHLPIPVALCSYPTEPWKKKFVSLPIALPFLNFHLKNLFGKNIFLKSTCMHFMIYIFQKCFKVPY